MKLTPNHLDQWRIIPRLLILSYMLAKRQEFHSFEVKGGYLRKDTIVRTFFSNGEYIDSNSSETVCNAS